MLHVFVCCMYISYACLDAASVCSELDRCIFDQNPVAYLGWTSLIAWGHLVPPTYTKHAAVTSTVIDMVYCKMLNWWLSARLQYLQCISNGDIKNNAWVTVNNDFWVTSEAICQWFSQVTKSRVKIIGKSHHEWPQKSLFTVTNVLFYFLHTILCPWNTQFC